MLTACCCGQNLPDRRTPTHVKKSLRTQNSKSPQNADKKAVRKAAKQEAMKMRKTDPANETPKEENKQPEPKDKKDQKARAQQKTAPDSSTSPKPQVLVSQLHLPTWTSQSLTLHARPTNSLPNYSFLFRSPERTPERSMQTETP